jgi:O-antigen ligase
MERLTFNIGSARTGTSTIVVRRSEPAPESRTPKPSRGSRLKAHLAAARERYDWDYIWMLAFTGLLFFRPQDHFPPLGVLHLAELTAIAGLAAMAVRRMNAGQTVAKITPEVIGIIVLGAMILFSIPFSIWPGGSVQMFSDIYVKIILIFALMVSTLTSPKRVRQMTWVMLIASAYIAARAVFDYARGVNLIEGGRVRGAVGGMFENPNDLALNLVTFLGPTIFIVLQEKKLLPRITAASFAAVMLAAIVCTKSRGGFLGLGAIGMVIAYYTIKVKPHAVFALLLAVGAGLPLMPSSFWERMDSITNPATDPSGSRAARIQVMKEGWQVFVANPITGVGAGQFVNYDGPGRVERWRVTHNVWLQVAAELGIFGFFAFAFLVYRAFQACLAAQRGLRAPPRKVSLRTGLAEKTSDRPWTTLTADERRILDINAKGMLAGLVGWFVCAFFASVAFNWTFYYVLALAVAGREVVIARRVRPGDAPAAADALPVAAPRTLTRVPA